MVYNDEKFEEASKETRLRGKELVSKNWYDINDDDSSFGVVMRVFGLKLRCRYTRWITAAVAVMGVCDMVDKGDSGIKTVHEVVKECKYWN